MNILFIGAGYMGLERLKSLYALRNQHKIKNIFFYDPNVTDFRFKNFTSEKLEKFNKNILKLKKIDLCIISTPHNLLKKFSLTCLRSRYPINLILEKPFGMSYKQSEEINKNINYNQKVFVALNYRFFNGIKKMLNDIKNKKFGKLYSVEINFGHGHNPEVLNSWKLKKKYAGGGVILDPGIHVINLIQLMTKNKLKIKHVFKKNNYWKTNVEDSALLVFSTKDIPLITINLSTTKWRSTFEINGNGSDGYWRLSGRGRSYGPQEYIVGKRWGWLNGKKQKDTEKIVSFSEEKNVFQNELNEIITAIKKNNFKHICGHEEGLSTMKLIHKIYAF
tara:strand:- start:1209 stop:2210 length:1002 start_codon:yes stop_codon:yes gene_type:complete